MINVCILLSKTLQSHCVQIRLELNYSSRHGPTEHRRIQMEGLFREEIITETLWQILSLTQSVSTIWASCTVTDTVSTSL